MLLKSRDLFFQKTKAPQGMSWQTHAFKIQGPLFPENKSPAGNELRNACLKKWGPLFSENKRYMFQIDAYFLKIRVCFLKIRGICSNLRKIPDRFRGPQKWWWADTFRSESHAREPTPHQPTFIICDSAKKHKCDFSWDFLGGPKSFWGMIGV